VVAGSERTGESDVVERAVATLVGAIDGAPHRAALFLDFDGTLAEIVDDPDAVRPVEGVLASLDRLAVHLGLLAIISGRPASFLSERLALGDRHRSIRAFGLYGNEEVVTDGSIVRATSAARFRAAFDESAAMARLAAPGARIEDKGDSVALHYRETPDDESALRTVAAHAAERFGLEVRAGRMVLELVAPAAPDKGTVVRRFIPSFDAGIAFGDDLGDIATFDALTSGVAGPRFRSVRIAVGGDEAPPGILARADVVLPSPLAAGAVLARTADEIDKDVRDS
jgi:trehalose 6-phosphate phosphatase